MCANCTPSVHADPSAIADAQARSMAGAVAGWERPQGLTLSVMQAARDRAYAFCMEIRPGDMGCLNEEDKSLIYFSHAVTIWQLWQRDHSSTDSYAAAYRRNPGGFRKARRYCYSVYADNGSRDARMLGPCMLNAVGGDFFGIIPIT